VTPARREGSVRETERLFVCAWADEETGDALRPLASWCAARPGFRATPAAQRHVTLLFLGEVKRAERAPVESALEGVARATPPIEEAFDAPIALPSSRRCRILGVGLSPDAGVAALMRRLRAAALLELEDDDRSGSGRPIRPHLTLARRRGRGRLSSVNLSDAPRVEARLRAPRMHLVRSTLSPAGPTHESIGSYAFGGNPDVESG